MRTNSDLPGKHKPQRKTALWGTAEQLWRRLGDEVQKPGFIHCVISPGAARCEAARNNFKTWKCWVLSAARSLLTSRPSIFDGSPLFHTRCLWKAISFLSPWGGQRGSGLEVGGPWGEGFKKFYCMTDCLSLCMRCDYKVMRTIFMCNLSYVFVTPHIWNVCHFGQCLKVTTSEGIWQEILKLLWRARLQG